MRKFIIWNELKTSSYDFTSYHSDVIDVKGLGVGFEVKKTNGKVSSFITKFDDIILDIIFGLEGNNPYTDYSSLALFLSQNGNKRFVIEYQFNSKILYADVWLVSLSKSQRDTFQTLNETLTFSRVSHWYSIQSGTVPVSPSAAVIQNYVFDEMPININFHSTSASAGIVEISLKLGMTVVKKISLTIEPNEYIDIDSEYKTIKITLSGFESNGYNRTNKQYDSFMMCPKGEYNILVSGATISLYTVEYSLKKWVYD